MTKKQTNILTADVTREQIADLAEWWGFIWNDRPNTTAVVRQCVERVWTEESLRRQESETNLIKSNA